MSEDVYWAPDLSDAMGEGLDWVEVIGEGRGEDLDWVEILRKGLGAKYLNQTQNLGKEVGKGKT